MPLRHRIAITVKANEKKFIPFVYMNLAPILKFFLFSVRVRLEEHYPLFSLSYTSIHIYTYSNSAMNKKKINGSRRRKFFYKVQCNVKWTLILESCVCHFSILFCMPGIILLLSKSISCAPTATTTTKKNSIIKGMRECILSCYILQTDGNMYTSVHIVFVFVK